MGLSKQRLALFSNHQGEWITRRHTQIFSTCSMPAAWPDLRHCISSPWNMIWTMKMQWRSTSAYERSNHFYCWCLLVLLVIMSLLVSISIHQRQPPPSFLQILVHLWPKSVPMMRGWLAWMAWAWLPHSHFNNWPGKQFSACVQERAWRIKHLSCRDPSLTNVLGNLCGCALLAADNSVCFVNPWMTMKIVQYYGVSKAPFCMISEQCGVNPGTWELLFSRDEFFVEVPQQSKSHIQIDILEGCDQLHHGFGLGFGSSLAWIQSGR